jgi:anti-sigma B factor antagonist
MIFLMSEIEAIPFAATMATAPDRATLRLTGELDLATKEELLELIAEAEASGVPLVHIDLRLLSFIDSTGISLLLQATDRGRKNNHRVEFSVSEGPIQRTLRLSGVDELLPRAA